MKQSSFLGILIFVIFVLFGNVIFALIRNAEQASSDGRNLQWDRFDVTINNMNLAANQFEVTETYELTIETGPYSFGFREIPMNRMNTIDNVAIYDGSTQLQNRCSARTGTYCVTNNGDRLAIKYYFLSPAQSNQQRTIRLVYTVHGALRSYSGGDQLYWVAVPGDRAFPVIDSQVRVIMPSNTPIDRTASYPGTWHETREGNTIVWTSPKRMNSGDTVEVRVQYPHNPAMTKPGWQAGYDREQTYLEDFQPIVSLLLFTLTLLLTGSGVLFVLVRYMTHGRDPKVWAVPDYLSEPPTEETPGIVGLLLDEKADMKDIMGTLVDLARRGYFVIEQGETGGIAGLFTKTEFEFHRTEKPLDDLRSFEKHLIDGLFPLGRQSTSLSQLKEKFYVHIPKIKQKMYSELVKQGYFVRSPETTRQFWIWGGIGAMIVASVLFWLLQGATRISPMIVLPPVGLGLVGAAGALAGSYMPAKTQKGSQDAAKWKAFRQYMRNIEKVIDLEQAAEQFEQYIGYAIVFGIEQDWIRQLSPVLTAMPGWYFPTHLGGPWRGGYHRGRPGSGTTGGGMGDFSLDGPGGLNDISRSLTDGLNSMSTGLTSMLNDASRAMTSSPKSSGSGGGGFSGGGGGGGGSGGGSAGFG